MERKIIEAISKYVRYLEKVYNGQIKRFDDIKDYKNVPIKFTELASGKKYYYRKNRDYNVRDKKDPMTRSCKYIGKESSEAVKLIKEARYYETSIPCIESNLAICNNLLDSLRFTDYDSINEIIPKTYRDAELRTANALIIPDAARWKAEKEAFKASCGPWYPEGLKNWTVDRKKVRSKSEALIYNHYFDHNVAFVYEIPLKLRTGQTRHPDFSILSEIDWETVILHDHQGMYGIESERRRYEEDMYLYWQNGFIPGINIFYTFDTPDGGFDIGAVQNIIDSVIRPVR